MTVTLAAPIKVNLALHVGPPQADGYHPVDTICVFPAMGDLVSFDKDAAPGIDFSGPYGAALAEEDPQSNLIWRAFLLFGVEPQGRFFLTKLMPVASGVGAGTADGVAAMLIINEVFGLGFGPDALIKKALGVGADGPVCMAAQLFGGGLWRAEGIGERVSRLGPIAREAIVVANPGRPVPTGDVFRRFDAQGPKGLRPTRAPRGRALPALVEVNTNDLAAPAQALEPAITKTLAVMGQQHGARIAQMSGSGATCFALHASESSARRAATALRSQGYWAESSFILPG